MDLMSEAITTVGVYLTEDERRLLTMLANDLDAREESALRRSEGPEAQTYSATREALSKLMHLLATQAVDAERMRATTKEYAIKIIGGYLGAGLNSATTEVVAEAIADCVVTLLTGVTQ